ncbi:MAG: hypothetical protein C0445_02745 [Polaromonas sp.]|nr:hypothetical protein [Polaromonas sp.]
MSILINLRSIGMEIVVQSQHPEAAALQSVVNRRVRAATQRLSSVVQRVVVRFKDLNGPRGGIDKQCQIQLHTTNGGMVLVSSRGGNWRATLELALSRASHTLADKLKAQRPPRQRWVWAA